MAIYHLHVKNISRRHGLSIVAAAAYRAGETLPNDAEERESQFGGRRDVLHAEIRLPVGAPPWMGVRARLWNAVEAAEKRKDARLGKEVEFALPRELTLDIWLTLVRRMADACTARGLVVDFAIHDDGLNRNPHAHILLATRAVTPEGFGLKLREVDEVQFVTAMRALWETLANEALGKIGSAVEISARSNAARGLDVGMGRHRGPDPTERRRKRAEAVAYREDRMTRPDDFNREAYREVLAEYMVEGRFPNLSRREDWPPSSRAGASDLSAQQQREHLEFWEDVDRAAEVLDIVRTPPEVRPELPATVRERMLFDRLEAQRVVRDGLDKYTPGKLTRGAMEELDRLEKSVQADGHEAGPPTNWKEFRESMDAFREKLYELRLLEEQNHRLRVHFEAWAREQRDFVENLPAPGPDHELVPQRELDEAQDRMTSEMERPEPLPLQESDREFLQRRLAERRQEPAQGSERERGRER